MEYFARTPSYVDVLTATIMAQNNSVINIPAGEATWNFQLSTGKTLLFRGNNTTLINNSQHKRLIVGAYIKIENIVIKNSI